MYGIQFNKYIDGSKIIIKVKVSSQAFDTSSGPACTGSMHLWRSKVIHMYSSVGILSMRLCELHQNLLLLLTPVELNLIIFKEVVQKLSTYQIFNALGDQSEP